MKIQTTDCWTLKKPIDWEDELYISMPTEIFEKKENMVVLTVEEFKKLAGNIFEAGARHEYAVEHFFEPTDPDKNEYIKSLLP